MHDHDSLVPPQIERMLSDLRLAAETNRRRGVAIDVDMVLEEARSRFLSFPRSIPLTRSEFDEIWVCFEQIETYLMEQFPGREVVPLAAWLDGAGQPR